VVRVTKVGCRLLLVGGIEAGHHWSWRSSLLARNIAVDIDVDVVVVVVVAAVAVAWRRGVVVAEFGVDCRVCWCS